jgi:hypothetical protein
MYVEKTTGNEPINLALAFISFHLPIVSFVVATHPEIISTLLTHSQPTTNIWLAWPPLNTGHGSHNHPIT